MNLQEFYDELAKHDWYYSMSDDISQYRKGLASYRYLLQVAEEKGSRYMNLLEAFESYYMSGTAFGIDRAPKPARPGKR